MRRIVVAGAGAFGTALALTLRRGGRDVTLWGRGTKTWPSLRQNPRLPDIPLPDALHITDKFNCGGDDILLLAVPTQTVGAFLDRYHPDPFAVVACCKGIDLTTGLGPSGLIADKLGQPGAVLTGPSFAADIARGLPTALTLATHHPQATALQDLLSTDTLRLYLSADPIGAELGGALKNVIAIACGIAIGAGLGQSARAALMTRGYAEMKRLALAMGAQNETLEGLAGFGDLVLTCTSEQSRNYAYGLRLGAGHQEMQGRTVEGKTTARAVVSLAQREKIEMPIATTVSNMIDGTTTLEQALSDLLSRPLRRE